MAAVHVRSSVVLTEIKCMEATSSSFLSPLPFFSPHLPILSFVSMISIHTDSCSNRVTYVTEMLSCLTAQAPAVVRG